MKDNNPTTVRLSDSVQIIKGELSPIYGLKNILSAGLLLFDQLSDTEQKKIIAEINRINHTDQMVKAVPKSIREVLQELVEAERQAPGTIIEILSQEDSALATDFRKALGPKPQKKKKVKRG